MGFWSGLAIGLIVGSNFGAILMGSVIKRSREMRLYNLHRRHL